MPLTSKFGRLRDSRQDTELSGVRISTINEQQLPLVYEATNDTDLVEWVRTNRDDMRSKLYRHGSRVSGQLWA